MKQVKEETLKVQKEITEMNDGHKHNDDSAQATEIEEKR